MEKLRINNFAGLGENVREKRIAGAMRSFRSSLQVGNAADEGHGRRLPMLEVGLFEETGFQKLIYRHYASIGLTEATLRALRTADHGIVRTSCYSTSRKYRNRYRRYKF